MHQVAEGLEPSPHLRKLQVPQPLEDRKSTRLNSSHLVISYDVFCLKNKRTLSRRLPSASTPGWTPVGSGNSLWLINERSSHRSRACTGRAGASNVPCC